MNYEVSIDYVELETMKVKRCERKRMYGYYFGSGVVFYSGRGEGCVLYIDG